MAPRRTLRLAFLAALAGCTDNTASPAAGVADASECPTYGDPLVEDTPALPGDVCPDPPSPRTTLTEIVVAQAQAQADEQAAELLADDAFTVVTCGTGAPLPSDRAQSCLAVFVGGQFLLFDAGDGAQRAMEAQGLPVASIDAVFLTHFHSDHMADLGEVMSRSWILGRTDPLPIYGGRDIARVVDGFNLVYAPDEQYRQHHHGEDALPSDRLAGVAQVVEDPGVTGALVYDESGVQVRAFAVEHSPVPALGYRVTFDGRSLGISGDTVDTDGLAALADDVDMLVSEAMDKEFVFDMACAFEGTGDDRNAGLFRDIRTYHIDARELGPLAEAAQVGSLVLTHLVPILQDDQADSTFVPLLGSFSGNVWVARDGDRFEVN